MREELRRCNYFGNLASMFKFARIAISDHPMDVKSINSICALDSSISIKAKACLCFYVELGLTNEDNNFYTATELGISLTKQSFEEFVFTISEMTLNYIVENKLISNDAIIYDYKNNVCKIKRSGFPFSAAVLRNLLIDTGALVENDPGIYEVSAAFESLFENAIKNKKSAMSLEQLIEIHKRQEIQGRLAEEFVVGFEKRRLLWAENSNRVKQISDFDVGAGYDILSLNSADSNEYDRFIEVKSYNITPVFFWSANEFKIAKELKGKYYLYLVDMALYQTAGYEPTIVQNPAEVILQSDEWLTETSAMKIMKV